MSTITTIIERSIYSGYSIGRHEGKIIMIKGPVIPGETVEVVVQSETKGYLSASLKKIIKPSPFRVEPACKYFGICGGCQLQHIQHEQQVILKEDILRDSLRRLSKTEIELSESIIAPTPWHYRVRGQFKVSPNGIGLYISGTRDIVNIKRCLLMKEDINNFISKIESTIIGFNIRELHITSGDSLVALVMPKGNSLLSPAELDKLASILFNSGLSGFIVIRDKRKPEKFGNPIAVFKLDRSSYTVSPLSFIQSNWQLNTSVVKFIVRTLERLNNRTILDLYAGAGNFSIPLASGNMITAVEENPYAIEDGMRNLSLNNISNFRFIRSSAEHFKISRKFDVVILDPPRPGLSNKVISSILASSPDSIIYLSCNPATFARDIKKLLTKYDIESVRVIDYFPQTFHIETLACLKRR